MSEENDLALVSNGRLHSFQVNDGSFAADLLEPGLATGAFGGHRWFVRDLVHWLRPAIIVELGSELGCSYSAFAEGVIRAELADACEVFCVDLWSGFEEHGFISSNESLARFQQVRKLYATVKTTIRRMSFDDAVGFHKDPIDLLLIDGVHTYEATKNDFEQWKHLLSERSVVLFHDIADGFGNGSHEYWREIKKDFPHLEFAHSYGLGVLFFGDLFKELNDIWPLTNRMDWYEYRWRTHLAEIQLRDHKAMIDDRDAAIASMTAMIDDRDAAIASMTAMIDDRDGLISRQQEMINGLHALNDQLSNKSD